jgi:quercetin dioxygenase-like cupin family protein
MIKFLQLPFHFNVHRMQEEVQSLSRSSWQLHYQTRHYEGEWTALPLRSTGGKTDDIIIAPTDTIPYQDTIFLDSCPYLKEVLDSFQCPLQAVRLLKLDAGAIIKEHHDAELYFEKGEIRIHIPVVTNNDVEFYLDKERMNLQEGECWYMNFNLLHSIVNRSHKDRIHLVIDGVVNDWVKKLFAGPSRNKKEIEISRYDDATKQLMIERLRSMNTTTSHRIADELEAPDADHLRCWDDRQ